MPLFVYFVVCFLLAEVCNLQVAYAAIEVSGLLQGEDESAHIVHLVFALVVVYGLLV